MKKIIDELKKNGIVSREKIKKILLCNDQEIIEYLYKEARSVQLKSYSNSIFVRGLIEFSNYCKNDCYYCGIQRSNDNAERYRLTFDEIISCVDKGYENGFRTFVLQSGEDPYFTDERIVNIVHTIKSKYPLCAVTLSIGEKSYDSYKAFFNAGVNRYLLRHETIDSEHYNMLHPKELTIENRVRCLYNLKDIGFQTGCGFMVGSPYQSIDNIIDDLLFIKKFNPHMVGLGPFIPHKDTIFRDKPSGTLEMTLKILSIVRLMLPNVLLPSTTALATISSSGRNMGILAGANVIMLNISPSKVISKYVLYNNKASLCDEYLKNLSCIKKSVEEIGYRLSMDKGDYKN